jgi:hypothetical protein
VLSKANLIAFVSLICWLVLLGTFVKNFCN